MFEINLVPDVKGELLKKQRLKNLMVFISIIVAAGSTGVVALLGGIVTGQNIALTNQDHEIQCRSEGDVPAKGKEPAIECDEKNYGTAILNVANLNEFLTIQDQMSKISEMNDEKLLLSRVFGVLDVILPVVDGNGVGEWVDVSELAINMTTTTMSFDAQGGSSTEIDYKALETFVDVINLSYFDYGRYMRFDEEAGSFVAIPTYCVDEVIENGETFGIYHKGAPGCESPVLSQEQQNANGEEEDVTQNEEVVPIVDVKIKRSYRTRDDRDSYMETAAEGNDGRYYFASECVNYGGDGLIDDAATLDACKLSEDGPIVRDSQNGRDSNNVLVLRFSASVGINKEVFKFANKHMMVVGPARQNVTDSYTQVRDMFAAEAVDCDVNDEECLSQEVPENGD